MSQNAGERRMRRSAAPDEALTLYLQSVASEEGLREVVITDEDGEMLCWVGDEDTCDAIASHAPMLFEVVGSRERRVLDTLRTFVPGLQQDRIRVDRVFYKGRPSFLAVVAEQPHLVGPASVRLRGGIERISSAD